MRVIRYTLKKYKYFPHTFFRVAYSSLSLMLNYTRYCYVTGKVITSSISHWKTFSVPFLVTNYVVKYFFSARKQFFYQSVWKSLAYLYRLEEQSSSTYLLSQINPVCPLPSSDIIIHFNITL
jgi:hypothetical protein